MLRWSVRLLLVVVVLAHAVVACVGGADPDGPQNLNPQPLPPTSEDDKGGREETNAPGTASGGSSSGGGSSGATPSTPPVFGSDAGTAPDGDAGGDT